MSQSNEHARPVISYRTEEIDGLKIFYREAGPKDAPTLLLLALMRSWSLDAKEALLANGRMLLQLLAVSHLRLLTLRQLLAGALQVGLLRLGGLGGLGGGRLFDRRQGAVDLADKIGQVLHSNGIIGHVGRDDLRRQFQKVV